MKRATSSAAENQDVAALHKTPTGVEGFDAITGGGLPRNRTSLIFGGPGNGKTVFALQTIVNGARQFGEPGIFVAFEENSRHILANAASFGWNLPQLEKKQLFFFDAKVRPDVIKAGEFDLSGMLAGIKAEADARGVKRIVFDLIDVLLTMLDDPYAERREITSQRLALRKRPNRDYHCEKPRRIRLLPHATGSCNSWQIAWSSSNCRWSIRSPCDTSR